MNKFFTALLLALTINGFAQQQSDDRVRKHELKANALNLIVFKAPTFSYEYLINAESSIGASVMFNLVDQEDDNDFIDGPYYYEKFAFSPYYRRFFSSKYAWGFFLEAFGMYNVQEDFDGNYNIDTGSYTFSDDTSSNMAFGVAIGGKFVSRSGFAFEFFGGVGRNIYTSNSDLATELVPKIGASLGYRF